MLPYMMAMSGVMSLEVNEFNSINSPAITVTPEWKRKKCKSCKSFPCNNSQHRYRARPLAPACDKYEKRK